jgi:hypothetical protein
MNIFAKIIIASDGEQVLAFKDNGDDGPELVLMTVVDGVTLRMGCGYPDGEDETAELKRDRAFEDAAESLANKIRAAAKEAVG